MCANLNPQGAVPGGAFGPLGRGGAELSYTSISSKLHPAPHRSLTQASPNARHEYFRIVVCLCHHLGAGRLALEPSSRTTSATALYLCRYVRADVQSDATVGGVKAEVDRQSVLPDADIVLFELADRKAPLDIVYTSEVGTGVT